MDDEVKKYFNRQKSPQKEILKKIRTLIQNSAPLAKECMSYGAPAFKYIKILVLYAAFKNHIGIYPEPDTIKAFKKELVNYETSKGTIKFSLDKPIPYDLIEKIIKYKYNKLI